MTDFRTVTDGFSVSPQISLEDLDAAKAQGFALIINNRPDGEAPGQPPSAAIEARARLLGLDYAYVPVAGGPTPGQVAAVRAAVQDATGPVLAYCRSGTRSIITWSLGALGAGEKRRSDLVELGEKAGYDLSGVLPG